MPLAIKNGLDGEIKPSLAKIHDLNNRRRAAYGDDAAPVTLLYRGGQNAQTPASWETVYREAYAQTEGRLLVDVAHGSEMAHDPHQGFNKSSAGQALALEHLIALAEQGLLPVGVMMEASDAASPTDPLIPFNLAIRGIQRLHQLRMDQLAPALVA